MRTQQPKSTSRPCCRIIWRLCGKAISGGGREVGRAFTLLELLVVMAIMGILVSLLLPALAHSKHRARSVACMNHLKQLQTAWMIYADENQDELPPNNFVFFGPDGTPRELGETWCEGNARTDRTTAGIERGELFPYVRNTAVYHCPSDRAPIESPDGAPLGALRTRSYGMSGSINCPNTAHIIPQYRKLTEITEPPPSQFFVFIDVHEDSISDAHFQVIPKGLLARPVWGDLPADRHLRGCNLSFADGHVEHWKWDYPKHFRQWGQEVLEKSELRDYTRLQNAVKPLAHVRLE